MFSPSVFFIESAHWANLVLYTKCLYILYIFICPLPMLFFAWTWAERSSSVNWCGASLALAWSPKNGEAFRIGLSPPSPNPHPPTFGGGSGDDDKRCVVVASGLSSSQLPTSSGYGVFWGCTCVTCRTLRECLSITVLMPLCHR